MLEKVCLIILIVAIQPWREFAIICFSDAFVFEAPVVEALLNARASVEIRNKEGLLPADIALPATWAYGGTEKHMLVTEGSSKGKVESNPSKSDPLNCTQSLVMPEAVAPILSAASQSSAASVTVASDATSPRKKSRERSHPEILLKSSLKIWMNLLPAIECSWHIHWNCGILR